MEKFIPTVTITASEYDDLRNCRRLAEARTKEVCLYYNGYISYQTIHSNDEINNILIEANKSLEEEIKRLRYENLSWFERLFTIKPN